MLLIQADFETEEPCLRVMLLCLDGSRPLTILHSCKVYKQPVLSNLFGCSACPSSVRERHRITVIQDSARPSFKGFSHIVKVVIFCN